MKKCYRKKNKNALKVLEKGLGETFFKKFLPKKPIYYLYINPRAFCLLVLMAAGDAVELSVAAQKSTCLVIGKMHARFGTGVADAHDPIKITNPRTVSRFTARTDRFNFGAFKIGAQIDRTEERLANDLAVAERERQKDRQPRVGSVLIFAGTANRDVFVAVSPVRGEKRFQTLDAFCKKDEMQIGAKLHHAPRINTPLVCIFD